MRKQEMMFRALSHIAWVCIGAFLVAPPEGVAGEPDHRALFRVIRDAMADNVSAHASGSMSYRIDYQLGPRGEVVFECKAQWNKTDAFYDYRLRDSNKIVSGTFKTNVPIESAKREYLTLTDQSRIDYNAHEETVSISSRQWGTTLDLMVDVLPSRFWMTAFPPFIGDSRTWVEMIDPDGPLALPNNQLTYEEGPDDTIRVGRTYSGGSAWDAVFSLRHGGNLLSYRLKRKTPRGTTEHEARLEWKRAPDHRSWYLASLHDKRSNGTIAVPITFHLTVDDYDNTRVPAPKVFTQAHLISLLPDTTYIRDEVEKKRYYKKKRPHVDAERSFDDLARELNSAGYLRGDR